MLPDEEFEDVPEVGEVPVLLADPEFLVELDVEFLVRSSNFREVFEQLEVFLTELVEVLEDLSAERTYELRVNSISESEDARDFHELLLSEFFLGQMLRDSVQEKRLLNFSSL